MVVLVYIHSYAYTLPVMYSFIALISCVANPSWSFCHRLYTQPPNFITP